MNSKPLASKDKSGQASIDVVKNYWEKRTPGIKHSKMVPGTRGFLDELEHKRYTRHYAYLLKEAEFEKHKGEKVLEIGCGMGIDLLQFAKGGAEVTGIDLTEKAIQYTSQHFAHRDLTGTFCTMNSEELDFSDNTFDVVYSFGVLHHTVDTQKAIKEVHRVIKPGGKAIIMLYHKGFRYYLKIHLYYGIIKGEYLKYGIKDLVNQRTEEFFHSPITRVYTRNAAKGLFSQFSVIESANSFRIDDNIWVFGKFFQLSDFLPNIIRRFIEQRIGWNIVIKALK